MIIQHLVCMSVVSRQWLVSSCNHSCCRKKRHSLVFSHPSSHPRQTESWCVCVCVRVSIRWLLPSRCCQGRRQDQNRLSVTLGLPGPPFPHWAIQTNMSGHRKGSLLIQCLDPVLLSERFGLIFAHNLAKMDCVHWYKNSKCKAPFSYCRLDA